MPRRPHRAARWLGLALCLTYVTGAAAGVAAAQDSAPQIVPDPSVTPLAALRLAHLSPDAPLVDLLVDGRLVLQDVVFQNVSGYLLVPAGSHDLKVFPHRAATPPASPQTTPSTSGDPAATGAAPAQTAGPDNDAPNADPEAPIKVAPLEPFTLSVDLEAGDYYTVAIAGFFNPPAAETAGGSLNVEVAAGTTVRITGPRSYTVALEQSQTLDRLEPGRYTVVASRGGFQSARYQLRISPGETTTLPIDLQQVDGGATPDLPTPAPTEQAAPVWHRSQLQLYKDAFVSLPPAGQVFVRVVHAAPGVNAVTVSSRVAAADTTPAAATPFLNDFAFPNASPYLVLASGRQTLDILLAGTDFVLATLPDIDLLPGAVYTLYLVGTLNDRFLTPLPTVDAVLRGPLGR